CCICRSSLRTSCMWRAELLSWLIKTESLVMSMLLVILHKLWSIIDDLGAVFRSVVFSHPALVSCHQLAGNFDRAPIEADGSRDAVADSASLCGPVWPTPRPPQRVHPGRPLRTDAAAGV